MASGPIEVHGSTLEQDWSAIPGVTQKGLILDRCIQDCMSCNFTAVDVVTRT